MGGNTSNLKKEQNNIDKTPVSEGYWHDDIKTGRRWVTSPIVSDSSVSKKADPLGGSTWGPYQKKYTLSSFGQKLFTPPESVDGVPILCRCRGIDQYIRDTEGGRVIGGIIALGAGKPACWEDSGSIYSPQGGSTFNVTVGHPAFYSYMLDKGGLIGALTGFRGFGGKGKKTKKNKKHGRKNQTRRRHA